MDNNFCVYKHIDKNGHVFYIGSGRLKRAYSKQGRPKGWKERSLHMTVEYVQTNISKSESLEIEEKLIRSTPNLLNRTKSTKVRTISLSEVNSKVVYDESSSTCLRWKSSGPDARYGQQHEEAGSLAGKVSRPTVGICGNQYLLSRVVWIAANQAEIPSDLLVDHIDGNPLNNTAKNLRLVSPAVNSRNRKVREDNKTGVTGVRFKVTYTKNKTYAPQWYCAYIDCTSNKRKTKTFSVLKYGKEEAFRLACEYRATKLKELNEQGAGYTERHGE